MMAVVLLFSNALDDHLGSAFGTYLGDGCKLEDNRNLSQSDRIVLCLNFFSFIFRVYLKVSHIGTPHSAK